MPRPPLPPTESYLETVDRLLHTLKTDLVRRHESELDFVRNSSCGVQPWLDVDTTSLHEPSTKEVTNTFVSFGSKEKEALFLTPINPNLLQEPKQAVLTSKPKQAVPTSKLINVTIVSAHGLANEDWMSLSDPYCACQIHGQPETTKKTDVITDCLEPLWNETFEFECAEDDDLKFLVFNKDVVADDLLGMAVLKSDKYFESGFDGKLTLQSKSGSEFGGFLKVVVEIRKLETQEQIYTSQFTSTRTSSPLRAKSKAKRKSDNVHGETLYSTLVEDYRESLPRPTELLGSQGAKIRDIAMCILIIVNASIESWTIQRISNGNEEFSWSPACSKIFCAIFVVDLVDQVWNNRQKCAFLRDRLILFDIVTVSIMVAEVVVDILGSSGALLGTAGVFRILRVARILRILRVLKVLSYASDVICLVDCLGRCAMALLWLVLLSLIVLFMVAHIFTYGASEHCTGLDARDSVCHHFGSLWASCVSLYQAMLGGLLWGVLYDDLQDIGGGYQLCLSLYMSFLVILYSNVTIGITVHSWAEASRQHLSHIIKDVMQHEADLCKVCTDLFTEIDLNSSGGLSYDELLFAVRNPRLRAWLTSMDIDCHSLRKVFKILDDKSSGLVNQEEFVLGCLLLHGSAKKVDVVSLQKDLFTLGAQVEGLQPKIDRILTSLQCEVVDECEGEPDNTPKRLPSTDSANSDLFDMCKSHYSMGLMPSEVTSRARIEQSEMRAMMLEELIGVVGLINLRCADEGWKDASTGIALQPAQVNLYQFSHNYMCPQTVPSGVVLKGLKEVAYTTGQSVVQWDEGKLIAEGIVKTSCSNSSISVQVTRGRFIKKAEDEYNVFVDGKDCGVPDNVEHTDSISYKELVSSTPTPPDWFCSHWWGESIREFVACCEEHSKLRNSNKKKSAYWVCAYANRQHDLGLDIGDDLDSTSFMKAMRKSQGTLLLLDSEATAFSRIWCCYEVYETVCDDRRHLDIVTLKGKPQLLTERPLPNEHAFQKTLREQRFPLKLLARGMQVKLQEGHASVERDRAIILLRMCRRAGGVGRTESLPDLADATATKKSVTNANRTLRAFFAMVAWPQAVKSGLVAKFPRTELSKTGETTMALHEILHKDLKRTVLHLNFASMSEFKDEHIMELGEGLPPNLQKLVVSFESCKSITYDGLRGFVTNLQLLPLTYLDLDFTGCKWLTDASVQALAQHLPSSLEEVRLVFHLCTHISLVGIKHLAAKLPPRTNKLNACFTGTQCDRNFTTPKALQSVMK